MIGDLLRRLTDEQLTSIHEIAKLTGRGESTIYRWIAGDSRPDYGSIQKLVAGLKDRQAKQLIVEDMTRTLPLAMVWVDGPEGASPDLTSEQRLRGCIESIDHIAQAVRILMVAGSCGVPNSDEANRASVYLNKAVRELIAYRAHLQRFVQGRRPNPEPSKDTGTDPTGD
jgi:transcriptional regulator with XRE-family HTH domain